MKALGAIFTVVILGIMLVTASTTFYICNVITDKNIMKLYNEKTTCEFNIPRNQYCRIDYTLTPTDLPK